MGIVKSICDLIILHSLYPMNNKIITIFLVGLLTVSCNQEKDIKINAESLTENDLPICKNTHCPEITINYLQVYGNDEAAQKVNNKIKEFIISSLGSIGEVKSSAKSIEEAASNFVAAYNTDKAEFPDMAGDYFAEISVNELYNTPTHICFEMRQYLYTGGAHGYGTTSFLNIDPQTGNELTQEQLFKNKKDFVAFAEKKFRLQQNISQDQSINEQGYWFENDSFYLPSSVGFTQDSIIFVYNQYDIASYAEGPIELKIAMNEAAPFLDN